MRFYCLTNMYLSSIQHGIQSAHCLHDMVVKYRGAPGVTLAQPAYDHLYDWMTNHKTMIVLNGGTSDDLVEFSLLLKRKAYFNLDQPDVNLAWGTFNEPSIGNALTCVGVILPERFYNIELSGDLNDSEVELAEFIASKHFAR